MVTYTLFLAVNYHIICFICIYSLQQTYEVGSAISVSLMRILRYRESYGFSGTNPGSLAHEPTSFPTSLCCCMFYGYLVSLKYFTKSRSVSIITKNKEEKSQYFLLAFWIVLITFMSNLSRSYLDVWYEVGLIFTFFD